MLYISGQIPMSHIQILQWLSLNRFFKFCLRQLVICDTVPFNCTYIFLLHRGDSSKVHKVSARRQKCPEVAGVFELCSWCIRRTSHTASIYPLHNRYGTCFNRRNYRNIKTTATVHVLREQNNVKVSTKSCI